MNWSCPVQLNEVVQLLLLEASNFGTTKNPINYNVYTSKFQKTKPATWFAGELLQCSIEAVLAIWYPETATRPSAVSAAVVPVFCSTATTNFTFKKTTARVKVKTARLPLEKMHVLQPALFLHPGSQQRFRLRIAELPNCNLDHLFNYLHKKKNLNMTEGRHQRLLIAIEVWWSRLWACCQHIFLANLFRFWKLPPAPALL